MNKMDLSVSLVMPIIIFLSYIHDGYLIPVFDLNSQCGKRISMIKEDIKGVILKYYSYNGVDVSCTVELGGWFDKMAMHFTFFDTGSRNLYVEIRHGDSWDEGRPITGMPGKLSGTSFNELNRVFTGDWMSIFIRIYGNSSLFGVRIFELAVNVFHTDLCKNWEFSCDNGRCIDKDLKCNGHNSCGDSSDCKPVGISSGVVAVICVSVASGGSCILSIVYYIVKDMRKKRRRARQRTQSLTRSQDWSDTRRGVAVPSSMGERQTEIDGHEDNTIHNVSDDPVLDGSSFDWDSHIREAQMYGYREPGVYSSDPPNYDTVMAEQNGSRYPDQPDQVPSSPAYNDDVTHVGYTPTAPNLDEELDENSLLPSYMDVLQDANAYQLNLEGGDSVAYSV